MAPLLILGGISAIVTFVAGTTALAAGEFTYKMFAMAGQRYRESRK